MFNKESCRTCGKILVPLLICDYCNENVSWICNNCQRVEDVPHNHDKHKYTNYIQTPNLN
ncbi:MAG TPA: hypothetical protein VJM74_07925 [Nitrososphaeraceae archaeon]|nr:hypothetical protein [Nitrososphaeraceae archaeon]